MDDPRVNELKLLLPRCMLPDWVKLGSRLVRLLKDRHHPDRHTVLLDRLFEQAHASVALREQRAANVPRILCPPELPIAARHNEIVKAIRENQVVIIAGETGSGKTTQIPKMCLEAGLGIEAKIGCTQPRRVAALSISQRIAQELNVKWGREVGCKIRFDDRSSPDTYIKLMTDGILLAETQGDPNLAEYNAIILDEAHERSLNIDFLLGYLKGLLVRRKDLKLIVTSATIDTGAFSRHFDDAPILEVSGRLFPVDVIYKPLDERAEERGDITYVDAAVQATEQILYDSNRGDILIFMPGERDIRETGDLLEGRFAGEAEVVPLFGRLSAGDQQRVFSTSHRRKIVIATNIAETSLTIPGIRYVIDTGLARMSRYNPRTRTRRLPVEAISQSSANQRKGRAGRLEDGICIRLYSEEDFEKRLAFTQPEIQRANLAEVILRMKAFHLGEMETFSFVQPPAPNSIANGYALLQELGALDSERELTELGRKLARLPIDPTLGRMLLQSQTEHATRELLIIASGLSIQDPRERPLEQRAAADSAHRRFNDPQSDFLALLNIWNAVHDEWETLRTQGQRRKFCRNHFLSYLRMREWQDLHSQLHGALENLGTLKLNESTANYDGIHRSILAGLLGHVALREERNVYKATGNRMVFVFPGSVLNQRGEPQRKHGKKTDKPAPKPKTNQPQWIVAGEIVETSQLFARTLAGIDPQWIFSLAPHCCKQTHRHPRWSAASGRVLAEEVITLQGLEVQRRKVGYGAVNPKEATEIFLRSALVEDNLLPGSAGKRGELDTEEVEVSSQGKIVNQSALTSASLNKRKPMPAKYQFLEHNRAVREKIEIWQTRVRRYDFANLDQAMFEFYAKRIENVSSIHELNRWLHDHNGCEELLATEAELIGDQSLEFDEATYPEAVSVGGQPVPLAYAYAPGEEHDGVTIQLPFSMAQSVSSSVLEWAVPGMREGKINELLRALPKSLRRELMPFAPKVAEIVRDFEPAGSSFLRDLATFIFRKYGVEIPAGSWGEDTLPAHLRARIEIVGDDQKSMGASRDFDKLRKQLEQVKVEPASLPVDWQRVTREWERFGLTGWTFGDLPERITVSEGEGLPVYAWPGLEFEQGEVNLRLFRSRDLAREKSIAGVRRLIELAIHKDLGWIEKDLRGLNKLEKLYAPLGDVDELKLTAFEMLKRHLMANDAEPILKENDFNAAVESAQKRLPGLGQKLIDQVETILKARQNAAQTVGASKAPVKQKNRTLTDFSQLAEPAVAPAENLFAQHLESLLPRGFLGRATFEQLSHLPRYLKALSLRIERAKHNANKDRERAQQLQPYLQKLDELATKRDLSAGAAKEVEQFRWTVREFEVSLFAQELGTAMRVSPKRLDEQFTRVREAGGL